jgi:hypothetical protein
MKSILLTFSLIILTASVFSQKKLSKDVQKYSPKKITTEVLDKKFYLVHKKGINELLLERDIKIIRRLHDDLLIIEIKNVETFSALKKSKELYKINDYWKFSPRINKKRQSAKRFLIINVKTLNNDRFLEEIKQYNVNFKLLYSYKDVLRLKVPVKKLPIIASIYNCVFIDIHHIPKTETAIDTNLDLSVNTVAYLHNSYPDIHGKDINVSVKELLFDIEDIDLKNRIQLYGIEAKEASVHATEMATIIGGAGNTSQGAKGVAFESTLTSSDFSSLLPDTDETYKNNKVYIQNHSYGTEIENFYGIQANAYDQSMIDNPELLHVFSSGNIGESTSEEGTYSGILSYANITGNFKMAKNVLVVGGINEQLEINSRSSKGPAYDGRIKPELVAHGPEGTSDAAAIVSGVASLLQQKYKTEHNSLPSSSLVKALLIAGADDVGPKGIDFKSGYGNVNASHSMNMLVDNTFINDNVSSGENKTHTISINSSTKTLKIALIWNDTPANSGDAKALVNDLDMELTLGANSWLPWVLDASPNLSSIEKEATRGEDHLNTIEYITVNNPQQGDYTLNINANTLVSNQSFSIAYFIEPANTFTWSFPTKNDALPSNIEKNIRWKNNFNEPITQIEYSINNESWKILPNTSNITTSFLPWSIPNTGGVAKLRALINSVYYTSEDFVISDIIKPSIEFNCDEEIQFSWNSIPNATGYNFQLLGNQYMTTHKTTIETSINVSKTILQNSYVSITPMFGNKEGVKGQTIDYTQQGVHCYYKNFYVFLDDNNIVKSTLNLSTLINVDSIVFERINNNDVEIIKTYSVPITTEFVTEDFNIQGGKNFYRARILLTDGTEIITETLEIDFPFDNSLAIYPNPVNASNGMFVYSKGNDINVQVVDVSGRVIYKDYLTKKKQLILIPTLKSGMYFVRLIKENNQLAVKKVIVN